jgi:DNA-binding NarL/FixJ family response regulator
MTAPVPPAATIRVVVADDHALFREGIVGILGHEPDIEVVGQAATGTEAVARCAELLPDVVLLDIAMPDLNGIDAIAHLADRCPDTGIVMLTMLEDDAPLGAALRAGARGYVLKGATGVEVAEAIRAVAQGDARFGASVADRLPQLLAQRQPAPVFPDLTDREREILVLLADGLPNAAIARRLAIAVKTVANHVSNILLKLQVPDRTTAAMAARQAGLGASPHDRPNRP